MKYALLIYGDEAERSKTMTEADLQTEMQAYYAFGAELDKFPGVEQGGEALHETTSARTVRVRDGKAVTTDGPFAETKEQLGGFYLVECKDVEEAIGWAAKIPGAKNGCVEVRAVVDFS